MRVLILLLSALVVALAVPILKHVGGGAREGKPGEMLRFGLLEKRPAFTAYAERLSARPASQRADARNVAVMKEHGIQPPS